MYKIYLNNFTGKYLKCDFVNGVAQTDNENVIAYYKRHNMKYERIIEKAKQPEIIEEPKTKSNRKKAKED